MTTTSAELAPVPRPGDNEGIAAWIGSPPMAALLKEFGERLPARGSLADRLSALEAVSARIWDYRKGVERREAVGEVFDDERVAVIRAAAAALGFAGPHEPAGRSYDHVLVLGGGVRTMMARSELAASVLRGGVEARTVAGLGSLRRLDAQAAPLPHCATEGDAVELGLRRALALRTSTVRRDGVSALGEPWWVRSYGDAQPPVHVLAAPSTRLGLRANTGDTLVGWAEIVEPEVAGARLLLVTTDVFVPFQHCDAIRLLGLRYGCTIDTIGHATVANRWVRPTRPFAVLQEVRSAIRSMQLLHEALS